MIRTLVLCNVFLAPIIALADPCPDLRGDYKEGDIQYRIEQESKDEVTVYKIILPNGQADTLYSNISEKEGSNETSVTCKDGKVAIHVVSEVEVSKSEDTLPDRGDAVAFVQDALDHDQTVLIQADLQATISKDTEGLVREVESHFTLTNTATKKQLHHDSSFRARNLLDVSAE